MFEGNSTKAGLEMRTSNDLQSFGTSPTSTDNEADASLLRKDRRRYAVLKSLVRPWSAIWNRIKPSTTSHIQSFTGGSFFNFQRRQKLKMALTPSTWVPNIRSSRPTTRIPSDSCRRFSLAEIKAATRNFSTHLVIGKGGYGNVYKGLIDKGATTVAIKRLRSSSNQGTQEFSAEVKILSKLRHLHLVSLIGYCINNSEMILVYDYMAHGSLSEHLYKTNNSPLNWEQRLQICLGTSRGLRYLHTETKFPIIHRDVKTSNILLDENWMAKLSDFGLSKVNEEDTHMTTMVKGTLGYLDPEYVMTGRLTQKTDVYALGMVFLEVLCGKSVVDRSLPIETMSLVEWAKCYYKKGRVEEIIDPHLRGQIAGECLSAYMETTIACISGKGSERPSMNEIVRSLENAMQLQEEAENETSSWY